MPEAVLDMGAVPGRERARWIVRPDLRRRKRTSRRAGLRRLRALHPEALPGEEGFHVVLFRRSGALAAALYGAALPLNLLPRMAGVQIRRARTVRLEGASALAQMDGDPAGALPVAVPDAPGPLRVLLPP